MLIFGAAMWALRRAYPAPSVIPAPWNHLGWVVMAIAPVAPIAAFIQLRRAHTTANPHKPETATTLVTSGVYAWTRNPMYLGLSILLLGWAIKLGSLSAIWGPVLFVPLIQLAQIVPEEHALRKRFPGQYQEYRRNVSRWFGRRRRI
jgi:protein-S-isoprenylcysteine O-methyltransferase Ste14